MTEGRRRGLLAQGAAYAMAVGAAALVVGLTPDQPAWLRLLAADVAATLVVFGWSVALSNSSLYDPYWSVAPPLLGIGFLWLTPDGVGARQILALGLTAAWGARLTYSFLRGWPGLEHEDWRYRDLRRDTGRAYWLVSFLGIHFFPTALTYGGSLALFGAIAGERPLGALDAAATIVTLAAIVIETSADRQLHEFVKRGPPPGAILDTGLWAWSRHPNYLGEMLFWWGLGLFALAAGAPAPWALSGPSAITLLFALVSIPMIERRMRARRPDWGTYARRVPVLFPWRVGPLRARSRTEELDS